MFTGIMNAQLLAAVLGAAILPFISEWFGDGDRLYQDNNPKHGSKLIESFLKKIVSTGGPPHQSRQILNQ